MVKVFAQHRQLQAARAARNRPGCPEKNHGPSETESAAARLVHSAGQFGGTKVFYQQALTRRGFLDFRDYAGREDPQCGGEIARVCIADQPSPAANLPARSPRAILHACRTQYGQGCLVLPKANPMVPAWGHVQRAFYSMYIHAMVDCDRDNHAIPQRPVPACGSALNGELVQFTYKGVVFQSDPGEETFEARKAGGPARPCRRCGYRAGEQELLAAMEAEWMEDWTDL